MKTVIITIVALLTLLLPNTTPASLPTTVIRVQAPVEVQPAPKKVVTVPSTTKKKAQTPAKTIHEYIERLCNKNCVDPDHLITESKVASDKYELDQSLLMAIVKVESTFNKKATNKSGGLSGGLMQVQVRWHKDKIAGRNIFNVNTNLDVGANILKDCMVKHKGKTRAALMCVNGYSNKAYPDKVLAAQKRINQLAWTPVRPAADKTLMALAY